MMFHKPEVQVVIALHRPDRPVLISGNLRCL